MLKSISKYMIKWLKIYSPECFWGDPIDGRSYLLYLMKDIVQGNVLDIGCGTGVFAHSLLTFAVHEFNYIGLELDENYCIKGQKLLEGKYKIIQGSWDSLPFDDTIFDDIIMASILEFPANNEIETIISEVWRVLKPGGRIWVTVPNNEYWAYKHKPTNIKKLRCWFQPFDSVQIKGWNPVPNVFAKYNHLLRWGTVPPKILTHVPGIYQLFEQLSIIPKYIVRSKCLILTANKPISF